MKVLDKIVQQKRNQFQPTLNSLATAQSRDLVSPDSIALTSPELASSERIECTPNGVAATNRSAFCSALNDGDIAIIGEIKPCSPSAGRLLDADRLETILALYKKHCVAISVLTDSEFFGGSFDLLARVKRETNLPVLCKDFIVSTEQIRLAKKAGADAILLIVKILSKDELIHLFNETNRQGLEAVVEINDKNDLEKLQAIKPQIVLINNRNLETMEIDLQTTARLANRLSPHVTVISASGIKTEADVRLLQSSANKFLIGTSLLQSSDLDKKLNSLKSSGRGVGSLRSRTSRSSEHRSNRLQVGELNSSDNQNAPQMKVCGITSASDALLAVNNGATFIGLIFAKNSPRCIDVETAQSICAAVRNKTKLVGVFQNQTIEFVNEIAEELDLDFVQLHGSEDADYIANCNRPVIKAIEYRIREGHAVEYNERSFQSFDVVLSSGGKPVTTLADFNRAKYILFDLPKVDMAETEVSASRTALAVLLSRQETQPFFIAGKLSHDTIRDAIALLKPFGIDLASAVEISPGIKSPQLLSQFCDSIKYQSQEAPVQVSKS